MWNFHFAMNSPSEIEKPDAHGALFIKINFLTSGDCRASFPVRDSKRPRIMGAWNNHVSQLHLWLDASKVSHPPLMLRDLVLPPDIVRTTFET